MQANMSRMAFNVTETEVRKRSHFTAGRGQNVLNALDGLVPSAVLNYMKRDVFGRGKTANGVQPRLERSDSRTEAPNELDKSMDALLERIQRAKTMGDT